MFCALPGEVTVRFILQQLSHFQCSSTTDLYYMGDVGLHNRQIKILSGVTFLVCIMNLLLFRHFFEFYFYFMNDLQTYFESAIP